MLFLYFLKTFLARSRLKAVHNIPFRGYMYTGSITSGFMTLSSFTMWAWLVEGVTFMLLGSISLYHHYHANDEEEQQLPVWVYRTALIAWEICAPTSLVR